MKLRNILYFICLLEFSIQKTLQNQTEHLEVNRKVVSESVIRTIRSCYSKDENIVMVGDWADEMYRELNRIFASLIPVRLIGLREDAAFLKHKRLKNVYKMTRPIISKRKYPANHFIIMSSSTSTLRSALNMLKESVMWNHEGFFLIICKNGENDAKNANSLLRLVWSYNVLSSTVMSYDEDFKLKLYTFNPYKDEAPGFWSRVVESDEVGNGSWTLYHRELDTLLKDSYLSFCKYQNFEKTRNLNGHEITLGAYLNPKILPYDKTKTGLARFGGMNGDVSYTIMTHLNVSAKIKFYSHPGFVNEQGLPQSYLRGLMTGEIEFAMNSNLLRDFWRLQSYPHETDGLCLISRKDTVEQLHLVFDPQDWLAILVMCTILVVSFRYLMTRTLVEATLELLRMVIGVPTFLKPDNFVKKTLFMVSFLLTMLISVDFQSELTSYDVAPRTSTINSKEDLQKSQLEVYGSVSYNEFLSDLQIRERYHHVEFGSCVNLLVQGQRVICVVTCHEARLNVFQGDSLHISPEIRRLYMSFSMVEDWPLQDKFNDLLRKLSEAGIMKIFRFRESYKFTRDLGIERTDYEEMLTKNVEMDLKVLACGLTLAVVAFIVEVGFFVVMKKLKNVGNDVWLLLSRIV